MSAVKVIITFGLLYIREPCDRDRCFCILLAFSVVVVYSNLLGDCRDASKHHYDSGVPAFHNAVLIHFE